MSMSKQTRRELLRRMSALSVVGAASSTFGLQLATMGAAAAQTAPGGYRALVCIFLFGGNDSNNMVLATDNDSWSRYFKARNTGADSIALMPPGTMATAPGQVNPVTGRASSYGVPESWGGVLPIAPATANPVPAGTNAGSRTFALHPLMGELLPIWQGGRLGIVANVGPLIQPTTKTQYNNGTVAIPRGLQSHNDQQSTWQAGSGEGARRGWGGLMADQMLAGNGANGAFTAISVSGNAVFLAGQNVVQYQISTNQTNPAVRIATAANPNTALFGAAGGGQRVLDIIRDSAPVSYFGKDYDAKVVRSMDTSALINGAFASPAISGIAGPAQLLNPVTRVTQTNRLAVALESVAKVIASNATFGVKRQVFFVGVGGYDTHNTQNGAHGPLMAQLANALAYFDKTLGNVNGVDLRSQVTTFTASDFSRTFTSNGDGTDHAWGAHHLVMGGAVRGGDMFGQYPTVGVDQSGFTNPDGLHNILLPTTSVDQYAGTMGKWFGLSDAQLDAIFPNLRNFARRDLGFLAA